MEWTREKTLILIDEYRKRRGLWDMTHEDYRKKDVKKELLDQVSQKFDGAVPPIEIEKKFHTLRTQYHREINRMQQTRGNETYKSKWFAFKHLQFLSSPKACRAGKTGMKVKIECEAPGLDKDSDEPTTKFIIKEVPIQAFVPSATVAHTISAEFLTSSEKSCDEPETVTIQQQQQQPQQQQQQQPPPQQSNHNKTLTKTEAERKRDLETLFEDAAKNVGEQTETAKVIIKHINVPVHFRSTSDGSKVITAAAFEPHQEHHHHHQEVEEHHLIEANNSASGHEQQVDDDYQNRIFKTGTKRDLYEEVMQYEEESVPKKAYYEKVQSTYQSGGRDEYTVYGEHIANELRFITSRDLLIKVKHSINNALFEASMTQLQRNS